MGLGLALRFRDNGHFELPCRVSSTNTRVFFYINLKVITHIGVRVSILLAIVIIFSTDIAGLD